MLLWALAAVPLGFCVGILTGLFPGIHVNVVASLMVGISATLFDLGIDPVAIAVFIVSVAMTHAFFDIIPSLFLGVPTDEVYALLPTQELVRTGRGMEAMQLSLIGSWQGMLLCTLFIGLFVLMQGIGLDLLASTDRFIKPFLFWILLAIAAVLILTEKRKGWALIVFVTSGLFGITIFATSLVPNSSDAAFNGLFPALSGLFGVSGLILSLAESAASLPEQTPLQKLSTAPYSGATLSGGVGGMLVGVLPGLGAANVATLMSIIGGKRANREHSQRAYVVTTSAINVADTVFGIASLYFLGKTRSGASVAINHLMGKVALWHIGLMMAAMLAVGWASRGLLLTSGMNLAKLINKLSYRGLNLGVIGLIAVLVYSTTGFWGVLILIGATLLGLVAPLAEVRRAQAMGMFLLPVILYYSGYQAKIVTALGLEAISLPAPMMNLRSVGIALGGAVAAGALLYVVGAALPSKARHRSVRSISGQQNRS